MTITILLLFSNTGAEQGRNVRPLQSALLPTREHGSLPGPQTRRDFPPETSANEAGQCPLMLPTPSSSNELRPRELAHPPFPWKFRLRRILNTTLQILRHHWMRMKNQALWFSTFLPRDLGQISSRYISKNVGLGFESCPHHLLAG